MAYASLRATAPGKLMLLGEHAVLYGHHAMVCAVNQTLSVELRARPDDKIIIDSELGHFETNLQEMAPTESFRFVLTSVAKYRERLSLGFNLSIKSQFSSLIGLGSSAAVTAATCAALSALLGQPLNHDSLFKTGLDIIRNVQSKGSGADLAASIYGGVLHYRSKPLEILPLAEVAPLTAVYAGYKTPTVQVIAQVDELMVKFPDLVSEIYKAINQTTLQAAKAWQNQDWDRTGKLMNINQGLMDALGVSDDTCSRIVYQLRKFNTIYGAKISGSGLGDCIIGLGEIEPHSIDWPVIPLQIDKRGVYVD